MDPAVRQLIEALHSASYQCVLALTGGGTQAAALLLTVPGGSRTILEVVVPYNAQALTDFLGRGPEQSCSPETSSAMAERALQRARWLAPGEPVVGLGCTASLATDRPKRGPHRFHVTMQKGGAELTASLVLKKGARSREAEEDILDSVILNVLAEGFGVQNRLQVALLPEEKLESAPLADDSAWGSFLSGKAALCVWPDGKVVPDAALPSLILSGAFNPLHEGHCGMALAAERLANRPAAFELSMVNVEKPPLAPEEIRRRLHQFAWRGPIWLTRAPTFAEKARLFPGATFVIGADTAARLFDPRFYGGSAEAMRQALGSFRVQGCRFLVAGRVGCESKLVKLSDLTVPAEFADLLAEIPEEAFRIDLSSTAIRSGTR
jgi:hypothetical protein